MSLSQVTAIVVLVAYLPACTSYQALADPVAGLRAPVKPVERARITLVSGERFELRNLTVIGDSLSGVREGAGPTSLAFAEVAKAEVRKPDSDKTAGLVVGILAVAGLAALLVANAVAPGCILDCGY
jgi:hypothetical protein